MPFSASDRGVYYPSGVSDEVVIRRATQADRATVLHFHRELYIRFRDQIAKPEVLPLFAYRDLESTLRDDVDGLLTAPDSVVLLAEQTGVPIGYVSGHIELDARRLLQKKGVIEDWFVIPEARGTGVGKLLMNVIVERFRSEACDVVESGTWAFNNGARRAHAKAGFTEIEIKFRKRL
jgi:GNAT superfamily N-acetyltransferase